MHNHGERHAVDKILQYLKARPEKGLLFKREGTLSMEVYTDADMLGQLLI